MKRKGKASTSKIQCSRKIQAFGSKNCCVTSPATYGGSRVLLEIFIERESKAQ
jgi:predicted GTPase